MKVALLGRTEIFYSIARHLMDAPDLEIVSLSTAKAQPEYLKNENDFSNLAQTRRIPFYSLQSRADFPAWSDFLKSYSADIAISLNWPQVLGEDILGQFKHGVLNLHFGDIPRFRGNAVTNWALLQNEKEITFTLHQMQPNLLDAGNIYAQLKMQFASTTTIADINSFAAENLPTLVAESLRRFSLGQAQPISYADPTQGFRCYPRLPIDRWIDWKKDVFSIDRHIRSLARPYSGAWTLLWQENQKIQVIEIRRATVAAETSTDLAEPGQILENNSTTGDTLVMTGQGILKISEIASWSAKNSKGEPVPLQPGKVWKSIRMRLGVCAEEIYFQRFIDSC